MPWPDADEFANFLVGCGLRDNPPTAIQQGMDLDDALNSAVEKWNGLTHYWPFLSTGVDETRQFDPPTGRVLDLRGGLVSFTSLYTDQVFQSTDSLATGNQRENLRDFRLMPNDAPQENKPWTYIVTGWPSSIDYGFPGAYGVSPVAGSIGITGKWGYCLDANLPRSARRGVMALAAQELMPQIILEKTRGGLKRLSQGDSTKEWDFNAANDLLDGMVKKALKDGGFVRKRIA